MTYKIEVDFAPAYELLISFVAYCNKTLLKGSDLGTKWRQEVRKKLKPELAERLDADLLPSEGLGDFYWLVGICPADQRTNPAFLDWLEGLSSGDLFAAIAPHVDQLPTDLPQQRDLLVQMLREWDAQYFRQLDPAILEGLERDAQAKRELQAVLSPEELYEEATNGVRQAPTEALKLIRIVPQYHMSPAIHSTHLKDAIISFYGCDVVPEGSGEAPMSLMRTLRCLSDESRLLMLARMAEQSRTFTELVKLSGLSKSTVHHHLIALRAAGLVRLESVGYKQVIYSMRHEAIDRLGSGLKRFLNMDES